MTDAARRHAELEKRIVDGRKSGTLAEGDEDRLLEEMGDLWWEMTEDERDAVDGTPFRGWRNR